MRSRARVSRRAATGSFSAHARGIGGPSARGERVGSASSGRSRASASAATHRFAYRSAPRPWKPLVASRLLRSLGIA